MAIWSTEYMNQTATYWGQMVNDGYGGGTFPAPVSISCRWQDDNQKAVDAEGNEFVSVSTVYPDQELELGGWLYLGESVSTDPRSVYGAHEIKQYRVMPDLSGTLTEVKAWL